MDELYSLLLEKGRVGKALDVLRRPSPPDPVADSRKALLYAHALSFFGDFTQALRVYSAVPSDRSYDAELLWGRANALIRLGDLTPGKDLLDQALAEKPSGWLLPHCYNTLQIFHSSLGQYDQALRALGQGIEAAEQGSRFVERLMLEGNRGAILWNQGAAEESVFLMEKAARQLLARDSILFAANFLINLSSSLDHLGEPSKAEKILVQAERLIQEAGSTVRLIFLKRVQGDLLEREGFLDKAGQAYREALDLLKEFPVPQLEVQVSSNLAHLHFEKGNLRAALDLIQKAGALAREKNLQFLEDSCLGYEGRFSLRTGATEQALSLLHRSCELAESKGQWIIYCYSSLFLAEGYEELRDRARSLEWLKKCLAETERNHLLPVLLPEKGVLGPLLLKVGEELPPSEFLSEVVVQLRHPALLKRLIKRSPRGKILFLRSLEAGDARNFLPQLARLKEDPEKEIRRTSRLLIKGWQQHSGYRVYAFGSLRVFQEARMLTDRDWIRPGAKRLFLFLATHPDKWHTTDSLLEALWTRPHPERTRKVLVILFTHLRKVFEPWSRLAGEKGGYDFFQSQRGAYGFFPGDRFWMDSREFGELLKRAEAAQRDRNFKEARKAYREALDLYLGDYLEEFPYEDCLSPRRDYLKELYFRSVLRYAALERDSGNLPEARRVLEEALFRDLSQSGCLALLVEVLARMKLVQEARDWGQRYLKTMKGLKENPPPEVLETLGRIK